MGEQENTRTRSGKPYAMAIFISVLLIAAIVFFAIRTYRYVVLNYILPLVICSFCLVALNLILILTKKPVLSKVANPVVATLLGISILISVTSVPFTSSSKKHYTKQMDYLLKERYTTQFFPEKIPDDAADYYFEFSPALFSDNSYLILEFRCHGRTLADFLHMAQKTTILSPMTLEEAREPELDEKRKAELFEAFGATEDESEHYSLQIHFPESIEKHPNSIVFVMSAGTDIHKPRTEVILIDIQKGWICFCRTDGYV